ncbi:MAG: hypothetical protein Q9173_004023 [Seirophora scorigena]
METTRIRGGTPTDYVVEHRITDPELLAQLDDMNRRSEQWLTQHIHEAVEQARAEYQYHPPPEMLDSDTDGETLPYYNDLPSPASTPPPSRPTPTQRIQSRNPAAMRIAGVSSTLPKTRYHCTCLKGGIDPFSNPGLPESTSLVDRVFTHQANCNKALHPYATTRVLAGQVELEEDQTSSHPTHNLLSSPPSFSPAAADPLHPTANNPVPRTRQSQSTSITPRSKSSASASLSGLQQSPRQDRRSSRPTWSSSAKKAAASSAESGRKWAPYFL